MLVVPLRALLYASAFVCSSASLCACGPIILGEPVDTGPPPSRERAATASERAATASERAATASERAATARDDMGHGVAAADADPGAPDGAAPTLVGSEPADGASDVAVGSLIVAHFSEAMLGSSLNTDSFQLVTDAGALLPGTVTASGADATFQASAPLPAGTAITASINWCAEDVAQNELTHSVAWSFTTAP